MSAPDPSEPMTARTLRTLIHSLLAGRRGRTALGLGVFVLVLITAARGAPGKTAATLGELDAPEGQHPSGHLRVSISRIGEPPRSMAGPPTIQAAAIDSLLARYDALVRLVEAEAVDSGTVELDTALADLRGLRERTYAAARRAARLAAGPAGP